MNDWYPQIYSIEFYEHAPGGGGNVPKVSYADSMFVYPHPHPVVTDAKGHLPPIYFNDANWFNTTDAVTRNLKGEIIARFSPMGIGAMLRRGFGER